MFWIVDVKSKGIYNNVEEGIRLFLFKKSAFRFALSCVKVSCDIKTYPLMRLSGDCFGQKVIEDKDGDFLRLEYIITKKEEE